MVYTSLTEAPRNLRESIDWLMALRGADAEANLKALGAAVHHLLADKPVGFTDVPALENVKLITKEFLEQEELRDNPFVEDLLGIYTAPMNKSPEGLDSDSVAVEESDHENFIKVWGLTAKMVADNLGLRSLRELGDLSVADESLSEEKEDIVYALEALGYNDSEFRAGMSRLDLIRVLKPVDSRMLGMIYDFAGFRAFY
ncbi:hypothetical protein, conserved [Babesia ovata]|uniref:Uncharacterized protein n=1 Tax=Babesia ovata TaxID=189622 RepID=A0A2H6KDS7_9APIC|nr:uncharacterized protein BOVATA_026450 [Babesia ovata]GBE61152.1 hypothetical protein, conserved [Babesia ovata]